MSSYAPGPLWGAPPRQGWQPHDQTGRRRLPRVSGAMSGTRERSLELLFLASQRLCLPVFEVPESEPESHDRGRAVLGCPGGPAILRRNSPFLNVTV